MKRLTAPLLLTLLAIFLLVMPSPSVDAQGGVYVSDRASAAATNVVNGQVLSTVSVHLDGEAYRVSEVAVTSSQKGELSGSILVEVPGGERPDGTIVFVSHTPALVEGELVQLAVSPTRTYASNALPQALDSDLDLYSVVGGSDGAYGLLPDGVGRAEAVGDYALTGASWPGFSPRVDFKVNPANSGLSESATIEGVRKAFDLWEEDPRSNVDFNYAGKTTASDVNLGDGQNTVSWVSSSGGWLAQASWITTGSGDILEFDVRVNRSFAWSNGPASGKFDIATVVGHEVGHGIGFAHAPASSELMYFQIMSGMTKGLGPGDRSGAAFLYPNPNYGMVQDPGHTVAANAAGDVVKLAVRSDGQLAASRDLGDGFTTWVTLGAGEWSSADAAIDPNGTAHIAAVKADGVLYTRRWLTNGEWDAWINHGGGWEPHSTPSIASNGNKAFAGAITASGELETAVWDGTWSAYTSHGLATWEQVDVDIAPDGDLWWVGVKVDGRLYARKNLGSGWSGYANQALPTWSKEIAPSISAGSNDIVYGAVKEDGRLFVRRQIAGRWQAFEQQGVDAWASVDVDMTESGTIWLAGLKDWGRLYTRERDASGWRGWQKHGLDTWSPHADASITIGANAEATFFAVKSSAVAYLRAETSSGWGSFVEQGGPVWAPGS